MDTSMPLRKRLENLPVGQKLLAALLVLLATVLLVANLAFISAAYWISQENMAPRALQTIGRLLNNPQLIERALDSPERAEALVNELHSYAPLRAAAVYDPEGLLLAQLQNGERLKLPSRFERIDRWRDNEYRSTQVVVLHGPNRAVGHLLLVASSELPTAFYTGTLTASLVILVFSVLLWLVVARQIKRLITQPIYRLEQLSRQVTREENYALRAAPGHQDEIGNLAEAFNTMLTRIEAREQQLKRARDDSDAAYAQARALAEETRHTNRKLELEVQVRSKIEKKLTGFQNYLNSIIDSMPSALIALDEQLYVTQWNQEASALSGTPLDEALNQPIFLAFEPLKPFLPQLKSTVEQHSVAKIERVTWTKDDTALHYALTFYPLMGGAGRGVVIRIDDITQRLSLEEMMVQSEKMLSVGGLAAGMAHEINNPLGAILHNVQNIRRRLSAELPKNLDAALEAGVELNAINRYLSTREVPQLLEGIQQAGARAAKIVTHMLSFSRRSKREMAPCDLPALIDQAVEIAGSDFDLAIGFDFKGQAIVRQFDPQLGPVPGTANELEQVLLNLLKNAAQAIHQRPEGSEPGRITLRTRLNPPWAEIQVEDNGIGMSASVRKRTFEPFFTTKEIGQGTGLGLSVSYFIITNNHKGQMEVHSAVGQGTCFTLRLPLAGPTLGHPITHLEH
jgi:PAS domain S-box-containing protein